MSHNPCLLFLSCFSKSQIVSVYFLRKPDFYICSDSGRAVEAETGFAASYVIIVPDMGKNLVIHVGKVLQCEYGADVEADVKLKASSTMLRNILAGKNSFQKGFMSGEITAKGNFKTLRMLDQIFHI